MDEWEILKTLAMADAAAKRDIVVIPEIVYVEKAAGTVENLILDWFPLRTYRDAAAE